MKVNNRQRLFVALPLSDDILQGIQRFRYQNARLGKPGFHWTPSRNLHITLFFIGNILLEDTPELCHDLRELMSQYGPMQLPFQCFASRPRQRPRMIWAQFRHQEHFGFLARRLATVCAPYSLSPPKREKDSIPHVTIARITSRRGELPVQSDMILPDLKVSSVELWSSELHPGGSIYTAIESFGLLSKP